MALAAVSRFYRLDWQGLWNDEMFSFEIARLPISEIIPRLRSFHHPPLFFFVTHYSLQLFGDNVWALRFPSALAGTLCCGTVFFVGRRLHDSVNAGLVAGILCSLSPFLLAYSQEGRPYALAALCYVMSFYFFWRCIADASRSSYLWYFFSSLALLYAHHWGIFFVITQVGMVLLWQAISLDKKKIFAGIWIVLGLFYLPEALELLKQIRPPASSTLFWAEGPNLWEFFQLAGAYSGTYFKFASSIFSTPWIVNIIGIASLVGLLTAGMAPAAGDAPRKTIRFSFICLGGSLLIPFLASFFKPEIFVWYRYTLIFFPVLCVLLGGIVLLYRSRPIVLIVMGSLLAVNAFGTISYYTWSKSNTKEVASYVGALAKEGYGLVIRPRYYASLLDYYCRNLKREEDEGYLNGPLGGIIDTTESFVYVSLDLPNIIRDYFDVHFERLEQRIFPGEAHMGIVVGAYRRKTTEDP